MIYALMDMHPVLTFFMTFLLSRLVFRVVNRGFRAVNIAIRGWPPAHLDADGDFR